MAMIDQMTVGHQFLDRTFGYNPRIGWQVDPFGHSSTQAALMTGALGFDALYFGRADYQVSRPPLTLNSLGTLTQAISNACSSFARLAASSCQATVCLLASKPVLTREDGHNILTVRLHTCYGPDDFTTPGAAIAALPSALRTVLFIYIPVCIRNEGQQQVVHALAAGHGHQRPQEAV